MLFCKLDQRSRCANMKRIAGPFLTTLAFVGCGAAKVPSAGLEGSTVIIEPGVPAIKAPSVGITLTARARSFVLDGDLADWREGPSPTKARTNELLDVRVTMSVTPEEIRVAVDFGNTNPGVLWIGLGTTPPEVPEIGIPRSGGFSRSFQCERAEYRGPDGMVILGPPNPLPFLETCEALKAKHVQFKAQYEARFTRRFRISAQGVALVEGNGSSVALSSAKLVASRDGKTMEVVLPRAVMPRLPEAPLRHVRIAASRAEIPANNAAAPWLSAELEEPVTYEPHGALRDRIFALVLGQDLMFSPGLSYHPDDPLHVESLHFAPSKTPWHSPDWFAFDGNENRSTVVARQDVLHERKATFGATGVEVALAVASSPAIAVFKHGKLTDAVLLSHVDLGKKIEALGERVWKGAVERNGQLHVFSFTPRTDSPFSGVTVSPHWVIQPVDQQGRLLPEEMCLPEKIMGGVEVTELVDSRFLTLGVRARPYEGGALVEYGCRWVLAEKRYRMFVKALKEAPSSGKRP